jgi:hypothetical protein
VDVGFDPRIAKGADQDGVEVAPQHGETVRRNRNSVFEVTLRTPVELGQFDRSPGRLHDVHCLRDDFPSNAVAGKNGNSLFRAHGK